MRRIGLHLRLQNSMVDLARKALDLSLRTFQCFFIYQSSGKFIAVTEQDIDEFVRLRREHFDELYVHGSYWINLASLTHNGYWAFKQELELAKRLEFTHMILHPGAARGANSKLIGIETLAKNLNAILANEQTIKLVLENTAHKNLTVGSDITDFKILLSYIDYPERISFCIDTAHAYAYGYNIIDDQGREEFISLVQECLNIEKVVLLHVNDTTQRLGSCIDKHVMVPDGILAERLKLFVNDERLRKISILSEPPASSVEKEKELIALLKSW